MTRWVAAVRASARGSLGMGTGRTRSALIQARLNHAADLLRRDADHSITDIALACGFTSSQYFATAFRRLYRCTPTAYRQSA